MCPYSARSRGLQEGTEMGRIDDGHFRPDQAINGVLAGLVAITTGCDAATAAG